MIFIQKITIALSIISLVGCVSQKNQTNGWVDPPAENKQELIIWVNSFLCFENPTNSDGFRYYIQESDVLTKGTWTCSPIDIEGFKHEVGNIYQLKVERTEKEGLPHYKLVTVMTQMRDPAYYRLHDIWALTHLKGELIDISEQRPTAEINLTEYRIAGNAYCNTYSGELIAYSMEEIQFGPLMSTKKMCPLISHETDFLAQFPKVNRYAIKGLTLFFYDANNVELLRFQKVD